MRQPARSNRICVKLSPQAWRGGTAGWPLDDRMPVILRPEDYDRWLDPKNADAEQLQLLLAPYAAEEMAMRPVSTRVKSPRNDDPECIEGMTGGA